MMNFCLFLALGATLATGQLFGLISMLPEVSRSFGEVAVLGLPLFAAGYATGMVLIGSLSGQLGAKRVLVGSLGGGALLSVACSWSSSAEVFLLFRFAEGVVLGGFPPAAFVATTQRVRPEHRLLPNSAMVFGLLGSAGLAGLISRVMAVSIGWRSGLVVYGVLLLMAAALASRVKGLQPGAPGQAPHPYRLVPGEAFSWEGLFSGACGAFTMAAFVTTNALALRGDNATFALVVVVCSVLLVLSAAKAIVKRAPDARRALGLLLVCSGVWLRLSWPQGIVCALAIVTVGATLVVPACIQQVVLSARRSVPAAVACFTCMLFVGGALSGLAMSGIVPVSPSAIAPVLIVGLGALAVSALVRLCTQLWTTRGVA